MIDISFKKLISEAIIPTRATPGSSGFDLYGVQPFDQGVTWVFEPGDIFEIPTGIALQLPLGMEGQVRSRSGLASKGLVVANSPGTIDSDYRGQIIVLLANIGRSKLLVNHGERVAQLVICPVLNACFVEVEQLTNSDRGVGRFGSTGR